MHLVSDAMMYSCSARAKRTLFSAKSAHTLLCEHTSRFSNWQSHDKFLCSEIES